MAGVVEQERVHDEAGADDWRGAVAVASGIAGKCVSSQAYRG